MEITDKITERTQTHITDIYILIYLCFYFMFASKIKANSSSYDFSIEILTIHL